MSQFCYCYRCQHYCACGRIMYCPTCSFELAKLSPWGMVHQEPAQRLAALASRFHTVIREIGHGTLVEPPMRQRYTKLGFNYMPVIVHADGQRETRREGEQDKHGSNS